MAIKEKAYLVSFDELSEEARVALLYAVRECGAASARVAYERGATHYNEAAVEGVHTAAGDAGAVWLLGRHAQRMGISG